jgi:hypothetical protein
MMTRPITIPRTTNSTVPARAHNHRRGFGPPDFGGSGGARVSLLTAANHPDVAARLAMVWVSGGVYGLLALGMVYCGEQIRVAWRDGMDAVVEMPDWAEVLERNPGNRARFLAQDRDEFIATMERWMLAYCPTPGSTVPGITDERLRALTLPTLIFRSGASDPHHTRATSEQLHALIPGSELVEPPWGDMEWNERRAAVEEVGSLFVRWPLLIPQLTEWAEQAVGAQPRWPFNHHTLGMAHYRARRYNEALKSFEQSTQIPFNWPGRPVSWLGLALAHDRLGASPRFQAEVVVGHLRSRFCYAWSKNRNSQSRPRPA